MFAERCLQGVSVKRQGGCSATAPKAFGAGAEGIRTPDPHNAIVVLYQLSYDPNPSACNLVSRSALSKHFAERY